MSGREPRAATGRRQPSSRIAKRTVHSSHPCRRLDRATVEPLLIYFRAPDNTRFSPFTKPLPTSIHGHCRGLPSKTQRSGVSRPPYPSIQSRPLLKNHGMVKLEFVKRLGQEYSNTISCLVRSCRRRVFDGLVPTFASIAEEVSISQTGFVHHSAASHRAIMHHHADTCRIRRRPQLA